MSQLEQNTTTLNELLEMVEGLPNAGGESGLKYIQCEDVTEQTIQIPEGTEYVLIRNSSYVGIERVFGAGSCIYKVYGYGYATMSNYIGTSVEIGEISENAFTLSCIEVETSLANFCYAFISADGSSIVPDAGGGNDVGTCTVVIEPGDTNTLYGVAYIQRDGNAADELFTAYPWNSDQYSCLNVRCDSMLFAVSDNTVAVWDVDSVNVVAETIPLPQAKGYALFIKPEAAGETITLSFSR